FGIAKDVAAPSSTTTMEGGVRGTPAYMAPERFFGQPAAIATDIYELAVTLYAMLAGRLPWDDLGDPEARLSPRSLNAPEIAAQVPDELDVEIRRALSTRAQNRPANASVFLEAVRAAAGSAAPAAADTARMRPASDGVLASVTKSDASRRPAADAPRATTTGERKPWFAERQATTDRGKTPLAWAPSPQAPEAPAPRTRAKRWPIVAAGLGAVALAGGLVAWRLAGDDDKADATVQPAAATLTPTTPKVAPENDPWDRAPRQEPPTPEIAVTEAAVSDAVLRDEAQAAIAHLPADTSMVIGALVGPLKRDSRFEPFFERGANAPQAKLALAGLPPCVKGMLANAEWFVFGSVGFNAEEQGTLIVRGRWKRSTVTECFAAQSDEYKVGDATMLQLPEVGWLDFLDEHTVYISVRQDLAAAQVHANVKGAKPLTPSVRALLAKLPADRMLTFVLDGGGKVTWPVEAIPKGTDMLAWLRPTKDGVTFDVAMETYDEDAAKVLEKKLATEITTVFGEANKNVADLRVERKKAHVRIGGSVSTLILGLASAAIPQ
ncbi:MAG: serine/threonine protein kinase, partial [Kofleriaceae bacterium]